MRGAALPFFLLQEKFKYTSCSTTVEMSTFEFQPIIDLLAAVLPILVAVSIIGALLKVFSKLTV